MNWSWLTVRKSEILQNPQVPFIDSFSFPCVSVHAQQKATPESKKTFSFPCVSAPYSGCWMGLGSSQRSGWEESLRGG